MVGWIVCKIIIQIEVFQNIYKHINKNIVNSSSFWGLAEQSYHHLAIFAMKLLKIKAFSAQLEKVFIYWAYVYSSKRNLLEEERLLSETSKNARFRKNKEFT